MTAVTRSEGSRIEFSSPNAWEIAELKELLDRHGVVSGFHYRSDGNALTTPCPWTRDTVVEWARRSCGWQPW